MKNKITSTVQHSLVASRGQEKTLGRPTGRVSKRDWLEKALEVFVSRGVESVKIVDLARQLNVAKSGFYWHFKDRSDLLEKMQQFWIDEFSNQFIEESRVCEGPLRDRLLALVKAIRAKESGKLDLAFTSWAQTDSSVRDLVDGVRDMRLEFARDLLRELDLDEEELNARARLFVVYFAWADVMLDKQADGLAGESLDIVLDIILGDRPG